MDKLKTSCLTRRILITYKSTKQKKQAQLLLVDTNPQLTVQELHYFIGQNLKIKLASKFFRNGLKLP